MSAYGSRLQWLDNLKAVGIIFVVFAHNNINETVRQFIYSFHMPLFFFVCGVLFNGEKYKFSDYIAHKFQTRIKPYFILSLITFLFWMFIVIPLSVKGGALQVDKTKAFIGIFYGIGTGVWRNQMAVALWFLPCLFCVEVIFYSLFKSAHHSIKRTILYTFIVVCIGCILNISNVVPWRIPWSLDTALVAVAFYAIGYLGASFWSKIQASEFSLSKTFIAGILISIGIALSAWNGRVDMSSNDFHNPILFLITPIFFIIPLIYFFQRIDLPWITFLGKNTLLILAYHFIALFILRSFIYIGTGNTQPFLSVTLLENCLLVSAEMLILYPIIKFHNRFLPWIMR